MLEMTFRSDVNVPPTRTAGELIEIDNPQKLPDPAYISFIEEPFFEVTMLTTDEYVGPILALAIDRRGQQKKLEYVAANRVMIVYEMPLNEVILDFFDKLLDGLKVTECPLSLRRFDLARPHR
mgnify:CR=1 FL=1